MSKTIFAILAICLAQSLAEECNSKCTRQNKPVCGVDSYGHMMTFRNPCEFQNEQCVNRAAGWTLLKESACVEEKISCMRFCSDEHKPVCGVEDNGNLRTFKNRCHFEVRQCSEPQYGWEFLYAKECVDEQLMCMRLCGTEYEPVCGKNYAGEFKTFKNQCILDITQCSNRLVGWRQFSNGECKA